VLFSPIVLDITFASDRLMRVNVCALRTGMYGVSVSSLILIDIISPEAGTILMSLLFVFFF
jgi:hypothetical protein